MRAERGCCLGWATQVGSRLVELGRERVPFRTRAFHRMHALTEAAGPLGRQVHRQSRAEHRSGVSPPHGHAAARESGQRIRTSRSASSSQLVAARMTSSRAGSPLGKTDFSKASRSTPPRPAPAPRRVPLDARASGPAPTVVRADDEPLVRRLVARADFPATPCARLRCAPSAAARPNVRPHSGQTNSPAAAVAVDLRDVARLPVARLRVARLLLARWVLAVCLFDVDISTSSLSA